MQEMTMNPAVAAIGAEVVANGSQGLADTAAAAPGLTALAPAGAEEVSAQSAAAFSAQGTEFLTQLNAAHQELARAGEALTKIAGMYTAVDEGSAGAIA